MIHGEAKKERHVLDTKKDWQAKKIWRQKRLTPSWTWVSFVKVVTLHDASKEYICSLTTILTKCKLLSGKFTKNRRIWKQLWWNINSFTCNKSQITLISLKWLGVRCFIWNFARTIWKKKNENIRTSYGKVIAGSHFCISSYCTK